MQNKVFDEKKPPITEIVRLLPPLANWKKLIFFFTFYYFLSCELLEFFDVKLTVYSNKNFNLYKY